MAAVNPSEPGDTRLGVSVGDTGSISDQGGSSGSHLRGSRGTKVCLSRGRGGSRQVLHDIGEAGGITAETLLESSVEFGVGKLGGHCAGSKAIWLCVGSGSGIAKEMLERELDTWYHTCRM